MFQKILVANRGVVAARVLRTLRRMGIRSVAVYSEADIGLPYLDAADEVYAIGPAAATSSYLNQDKILEVLKASGADALHPGYGFLSENAGFASRVNAIGACFIGPSPQWIEAMGHKTRARSFMAKHGMPMSRSSDLLLEDADSLRIAAEQVGFPVLVKPAAGGGGIGMLAANNYTELLQAVTQARSMAARSFGSSDLYLEQLIKQPRHIEFQILADRFGHACHLFERDCSIQRRHQKVIEESPAPLLPRDILDTTAQQISNLLQNVGYDIIGTAETLYGGDGQFNFLEMNTRLQVEHAVTEEITGIDLVEAQIRLAAGALLADVIPSAPCRNGHAIQVRIYAEDPVRFYPSPGLLDILRFPEGAGIRVECGYAEGNRITPHYDPMIAKLIIHAKDRPSAIEHMLNALDATVIRGVKTNIPFIQAVLCNEAFRSGAVHTGLAANVQVSSTR